MSSNDIDEVTWVWPRFSGLFSWAWLRHLKLHNHAEYEVCDRFICRIVWGMENWLWYGGEVG